MIAAAGLLTALSLFLAISSLKTQTGILDLYSENSAVNRRFLEYARKFGAVESLIIVFEGENQDRRRQAMD
ncbi:MAG TPA: hypothetical protein DF383_09130, partial [Deltaproteobacteria bacterium]|nr:hypothetical protein [Deltaproteobacteria bacterium]